MPDLPKKLQEKLSERETKKTFRSLPSSYNSIDFSSNDYLGFAKNDTLFAHTFQLLLNKGISQNGATGSRLLSGNHELYDEAEALLAKRFKVKSSLIFNSGYDANIGFFSAIPQRTDIVFYDELVHASIRDGINIGNAKNYKFKHNDIDDLKSKISLASASVDAEIYIVTESVFSMDGDSPDLKALTEFCAAKGYHLIVDEAHAIGVFGKKGTGLIQEMDLQDTVFARIITFGKALGCHGAAIVGSEDLKDYLVNFARSFIYTTGLPPHSLAIIIAASKFITSENGKEQQKRLIKNITYFNNQLEKLKLKPYFISSNSAVHCCIIPGNKEVKSVAKKLAVEGFEVKAILSPTVSEGQERLRFCLHSFNAKEEIGLVLQLLKGYL